MADSKIRLKLQSEADVTAFGRMKSEIASLGTKARTAMAALKSSFSSGARSVMKFAASVGSNLMNIKAGFDMLKSAVTGIVDFMKNAFDFETQTAQFKHFLGTMDAAREHMRMLKELGDTPPFSLDEFAKASRAMMVMTDGALGFKDSLEMVGDAAAATGNPLEQVAHEVGKAYAAIRDGQPVSRAVAALKNMGVVTPEVVRKLKDLQDQGAGNDEVWKALTDRLKQYGGAMNDTLDTGNGKLGALGAKWDDLKRRIAEHFAPAVEKAVDKVSRLIDLLNSDPDLGWARDLAGYMESAARWAYNAAKWIGTGLDDSNDGLDAVVQDKRDREAGWKDWEEWQRVDEFTRRRKRVNDDGSEQFQYETDEKAKAEAEAKKKAEEDAARVRQQLKDAQDRRDEEEMQKQIREAAEAELNQLEERRKEDDAAAKKRQAEAEKLAREEEAREAKLNEEMFKRLNDEADKRFDLEEKIAGKKKELDKAVAEADAKRRLEDQKKRRDAGIQADAKYHNGLFGQYRYDTDENGNLKKFRDWQRANRYAGRAERDEQRGDPDQRRFDKLVDRMQRGRKLSKKDQEFFDQYQDFLDQKNAQQNIDQNVQRIANDITQLKNQLAQMGVK